MSNATQETSGRDYTVIITSCGRFDLLRQTVESLLKFVDQRPAKIILTEDSGDDAVHQVFRNVDIPTQIHVNRPQLGQMKSIDLAYGSVETDYVFHCEDDWEFLRSGFIAESFALLDQFPKVSMVGLRARDELNPLVRGSAEEILGDLRFFKMDPGLHPEYFSYSFNPGLRRLSDFRLVAPVDPLGGEEDVSYAFKKLGFQIANLETPAVRHIGYERHVDDPSKPPKAKTIGQKLRRSIRKRVKRLGRILERN